MLQITEDNFNRFIQLYGEEESYYEIWAIQGDGKTLIASHIVDYAHAFEFTIMCCQEYRRRVAWPDAYLLCRINKYGDRATYETFIPGHNCIGMEAVELEWKAAYWSDPDNDLCSGQYDIQAVHAEEGDELEEDTIILLGDGDSEVECTINELIIIQS